MNLCKRACLYSIRKKGKTLTLLAFLLVMATLMLTCLSIQSATETANANIKKALLGYFTINAKTLENGIPEDTVSQILDVDGLSGRYTLRSYTYATYFDADGNLLEINTEGAAQVPEGYENAGRVVANSNSQEDSYFTDGGFEMVEGSPITTETGSQVLIHEKFAQRNGLSVGDTMLLGNVEDKDKTIPVTVAGIFTNTEEQDSIGMAPSYDLYDNIVFTDLSTASFLLYGTEGTTNVQYGDFYVNDPDELERIMTDVQELDGVDWESCTLTRYDNDYQNAKESLEGLQNIVFIAIAVVSVICFLVLALFLTLRLRGRIHETGVYDRYSAQYLVQDMAQYGFHMDDVYQGTNLTPVIQEVEGLIRDKTFDFGDNDLLKIHLLNMAVKKDGNAGRCRVVKIKPSDHIDGGAALLDAMCVRQKYYAEIGHQLKNVG